MLRNRWTKVLLFLICIAPACNLAWRFYKEDLTLNPLEFITHYTGDWTIWMVMTTLAITPLRKLLHLPDLIRFRRMIGLFAFFYGLMHFSAWLYLDKLLNFSEMFKDVAKRPFITAGMAALLAMLPLAITSTTGWIRRLGGKRWQMLHRLVYFTAIAGVVHYYWLVKSDVRLPLLYGAIVAALLSYRVVTSLMSRKPKPASKRQVPATT